MRTSKMPVLESANLQMTDLTGESSGCVTLGSNKFWKGWVESNPNGTYDFKCLWGPTGDPGSDKGSKTGISQDEALTILRKKKGEKLKKGYKEVVLRGADEVTTKPATTPAVVKSANLGSAPRPEVARLLKTMFGASADVLRAGLSSAAGTSASKPFGNLSGRQIDSGADILTEVERTVGKDIVGENDARWSKLVSLTNEYLSTIPREIPRHLRGKENLSKIVIRAAAKIEEERQFLTVLRDAKDGEAVYEAVQEDTTNTSSWLDNLNVSNLDIVDRSSAEYAALVRLFMQGQSKKNANWSGLKVVTIYTLSRKGADDAFRRYANKVTAKPGAVGVIKSWHGTRTENLQGITRRGLLMPENLPKGVVISGKAFGLGIYHAPCWTDSPVKTIEGLPVDGTNGALKSMNYTSCRGAYYNNSASSNSGFLYLQELALGRADVRTSAAWDMHRPAGWPTKDHVFACGTRNQGGFVHDEIVSFDQDAQRFTHLFEVSL